MARTRLLAACLASTAAIGLSAHAEDLTVAALHADEGLSGPSVRGAAFSPDGSMITLLRGREDDARTLDLWAYDVETGEPRVLVRSDDLVSEDVELSEEEKNRRERQRIYDSGIISYQWDKAGEKLLFPLGGDVYLYDLESGSPTRVTETEGFETDPKMSPGGRYVSYVRDDELFVFDTESDKERQVTRDADGVVRNAVAEFVAQEELGRDTGYWWSQDDSMIVFTQIDESPVDIVERLDFTPEGSQTISQRYPFAGTDNVKIKLGVTRPNGGRTRWIDLGENEDIYVADVVWHDGNPYVLRLSRDQKTLDVLRADPRSGETEIVFTETSDTWINLHEGGFRSMEDGTFFWESERDGRNHVYHYEADGTLIGSVTSGDWIVDGVECVDEANGALYVTGREDSFVEKHLFRVDMESGDRSKITTAPGWHDAQFAEACGAFIHTYSSQNQPPQTSVADAEGERRFWLVENALDDDHPYANYLDSHLEWQFGQVEAEDGQMMDYAMLVPEGDDGDRAAIQYVYGGPHVQRVSNRWGDHWSQLLADQGYVVFKLDNRGAWGRGKAFEDTIYRTMGQGEVRDQAAGTEWLVENASVDPDRIGVQGWSYGGYMTLMMLAQEPELYAAGVSGAPVSDWRTYDTAYTERYMGDPRTDEDKYDASSVLTYIDGIQDDALLLIHGMADDNVIFQNAIDVMAALQARGTEFSLMTYPGEKHGFRDTQNKIHRDEETLRFLADRLSPNGD